MRAVIPAGSAGAREKILLVMRVFDVRDCVLCGSFCIGCGAEWTKRSRARAAAAARLALAVHNSKPAKRANSCVDLGAVGEMECREKS